MLDLNTIDKTYRQRGWGMFVIISFCFLWSIGWTTGCFLNKKPIAAGFSTMPYWTTYFFGLAGPAVFVLGIYLIRSYRNERFQIKNGELIHIGASGRVKRNMPLTDIVWVTISEPTSAFDQDGWSCSVLTRSGTIWFGETLNGYREFAKVLDQVAKQNPSKTEINLRESGDLE